MRLHHRLIVTVRFLLAGVWGLGCGCAFAADKVDYLREIKPVFAARCFTCHGALKQQAGLRLDTVAAARQGGESGPAITPGKSAESLLIARVTHADESHRMPPESEGQRLTTEQIARLKAWIDQGAIGPANEKPEPDPREHWAFRPVVRPAVPGTPPDPPLVRGGSRNPQFEIRNPIDAFIAAEHARRGLAPQPPADKRTLLRRVYLDLIGLPPTREELAAFVADESPRAYERVVERLLNSPQYGERWGRHWMDIWRYSDWWGLGAEVRNSQKHIWHWRDWIVESLNADVGYDELLRQMLAADELYPTDLAKVRATGFLARQYFIFNRTTWLDETIEHTSKAFLGLTLNCTKCHDHKYDPLGQTDYYRLRAFFEPYQVRTDQVPGEADYAKDGIPRVFDCNLDTPTYVHTRGDDRRPQKDKPLAPGVPAIFTPLLGELKIQTITLPPEAHQPGLRPHVLENHLAAAQQQIAAARSALEQAKKKLADVQSAARITAAKAQPGEPGRVSSPSPAKAEVTKPVVQDDFAAAKPDRWELGPGDWKYDNGRLVQKQTGDSRAALRLKAPPPADFQARFRFTPTGGQMWKSVGLSFDVAGENEVLVYLSAYAGGSKLQIAYKQSGAYVYPNEAMQARPVKLGEGQDLLIRVRGSLINVSVNGEHALAWRLPIARKPGKLELITYDATAEFTRFELSTLPAGILLKDAPGSKAASAKPLTVEEAKLALIVAERALDTAEAQPPSLRARAAADKARHQQPPAANAAELARAAARAERQAAAAKAAEDLARAELELLKAESAKKPEVEKKLAAAKLALEAARKAIDTPGENYTPLRGSLKAPESNLETEASRMKPYPTQSTGRRAALSRWLTDRRHPLTARVAVNHIWNRHFGQPLVPTVFDFGRKGTPPTHPALLDWLAAELMDYNWSMKHIHRLIVTSSTYRLSSSTAGANLAADPENKHLWRMKPVRIEAQVVRDSLLHLSGELDLTRGGPSIPLAQEETSRRRSLYFVHSHNDHSRFLSIFDDANVLECYRRSESIVPQQALALSNSKLALASAEKIAARLNAQSHLAGNAAFVKAAYETVLCDLPTPDEQAACEQALREFVRLNQQKPSAVADQRARTHLIHVLLNHNDFVTRR